MLGAGSVPTQTQRWRTKLHQGPYDYRGTFFTSPAALVERLEVVLASFMFDNTNDLTEARWLKLAYSQLHG
jgi:hypothetical protein